MTILINRDDVINWIKKEYAYVIYSSILPIFNICMFLYFMSNWAMVEIKCDDDMTITIFGHNQEWPYFVVVG
jgi:hypothetical protein